MSELATARAMAFRVEDMEIEERVEALTEWGRELWQAAQQEERSRETDRFLDGAMGAPSAPEPEAEFGQRWADTLDAAEEPASLVEQVQPIVYVPDAVELLARAIDALTAEVESLGIASRLNARNVEMLRADLDSHMEHYRAHVAAHPFPAGPGA